MNNNNIENIADQITGLFIWAYLTDNKAWATKKLNQMGRAHDMDELRVAKLVAEDNFQEWRYKNEVASNRVDDAGLASELARLETWQNEYESMREHEARTVAVAEQAHEFLFRKALRGWKGKEGDVDAAMRKRNNIDNRAYYKAYLLEQVKTLQTSEDLAMLGIIDMKRHKARLWKVVTHCNKLLTDRKARNKRGFTWTSVAALKNNALSLLENVGVKVGAKTWARNFQKQIVDFEEPQYNPDKTGEDWNDEVRMEWYGMTEMEYDHLD